MVWLIMIKQVVYNHKHLRQDKNHKDASRPLNETLSFEPCKYANSFKSTWQWLEQAKAHQLTWITSQH